MTKFTPIKTLFKFNAINITIGLPFIRISPDHGPNFRMLGMNKSNPSSFYYAMKFIENFYCNESKEEFRTKLFK